MTNFKVGQLVYIVRFNPDSSEIGRKYAIKPEKELCLIMKIPKTNTMMEVYSLKEKKDKICFIEELELL
jgi:hypothetical protein